MGVHDVIGRIGAYVHPSRQVTAVTSIVLLLLLALGGLFQQPKAEANAHPEAQPPNGVPRQSRRIQEAPIVLEEPEWEAADGVVPSSRPFTRIASATPEQKAMLEALGYSLDPPVNWVHPVVPAHLPTGCIALVDVCGRTARLTPEDQIDVPRPSHEPCTVQSWLACGMLAYPGDAIELGAPDGPGGVDVPVLVPGFVPSGIGVSFAPGGSGFEILSFLQGSPAYSAGLREGDLIVEVEGTMVASDNAVRDFLSLLLGPPGSTVRLVIERRGTRRTVSIVRKPY